MQSIEYVLRSLDKAMVDERERAGRAEKMPEDFLEQAGRPYEHEAGLKELLSRQVELNAALDLDKGERQIAPPAGGEGRLRESVPSTFAARTINALMWDTMHFVMEQRMLRGIKERAEGQSLVPVEMMLVARIGWILAGVSLLALFLARRR